MLRYVHVRITLLLRKGVSSVVEKARVEFPEFSKFPKSPKISGIFRDFPEGLTFSGFPPDFGGKIPGFFRGFRL